MNVVGLGNAGCSIAKYFENYPQYNVFYVDVELGKSGRSYGLTKRDSHEDYDKKQIRMAKFINQMPDTGECLFIMAGSGDVTGASLQVLKFLDKRFKVDVLYIKPDHELLGRTAYLQDRICYNILQEYARSGVFRSLCLISNPSIEEILENSLTATNYYEKINELIGYTFHMLNVFKRTTAVLDNKIENPEQARIYSIGMVDFETGAEKSFFPIDNETNRCYYYAVNDKVLEEDYKVLKKVSKQVKEKMKDLEGASYQIHSTKYETNFAFVETWTSNIQNYPEGGDNE